MQNHETTTAPPSPPVVREDMAIELLQRRLDQARLLSREGLHASTACILAALAADAARCAATHRTLHILQLERDLALAGVDASAPAEPARRFRLEPKPEPLITTEGRS